MTPLLAGRSRADRAFERLYEKHVGDVYRYALVVLRDPNDAEDVTQTTFMNAYRAFARGERPRTPQNWLITIAHNVCRQRFRQSARRPNELPLEEELAEAHVPDEEAPSADDIRRALGHLAFNQRAALVMRELEGRSYGEIAEVLGVSTSAVETLIFRARRALREQLEGGLTCHEAELAVSKQLDGRLNRTEKGQLRAHLRECSECASFARSQRAQRTAIRALVAIPLPPSLLNFFGSGGATTATASGGGIGAALGGVSAKVALIGASTIVATGVGVSAGKKAGWHPFAKTKTHVAVAHRDSVAASRADGSAAPAAAARTATKLESVAAALPHKPTRMEVREQRAAETLRDHPVPGRGALGKGRGLAVGATGGTPPGRALGRTTQRGHSKKIHVPPIVHTRPVTHTRPVHPTHPVTPTHPSHPAPPPPVAHPAPPPPPPPPPEPTDKPKKK